MITIIIIFIAAIAFEGYLFYILREYGVPHSLSETYYFLQKKKGAIFQALMVGIGILMIGPFIEATPESVQFLAFLPCASLLFIGIAPRFADSYEGKIHYIATGIASLTTLCWFIFADPDIWCVLVAALLIAAIAIIAEPKKWMFWIECAFFISVFVGVIGLII